MGHGGGGGGRKGGGARGGGLSAEEKANPLTKAPTGEWVNAKEGKRRYGVRFGPIERDANGDAVRAYTSITRQGSRADNIRGVVRMKDGAIYDYMDKNGNLRNPSGGHDAIDAVTTALR